MNSDHSIGVHVKRIHLSAEKHVYAEGYISLIASILDLSVFLPKIGTTILPPCSLRLDITLLSTLSCLSQNFSKDVSQLLTIDAKAGWLWYPYCTFPATFVSKSPLVARCIDASSICKITFSKVSFQFSSDCIVVLHTFLDE